MDRDALNGENTLASLKEALGGISPNDGGSEPSGDDLHAARAVLTDRGLNDSGVFDRQVSILEPHLPRSFRFTEYSTLPGRIDLSVRTANQQEGPGRTGLQAARALPALAGTDLGQLKHDDYELRRGSLKRYRST